MESAAARAATSRACRRDPRPSPEQALYVGGQNAHAKKETERVDEDMALAARDLLARIKALRVNRRAPF